MKIGYIPKEKRKKIMLLSDDIRVHSGVATVARELVLETAHHFNWVNIGAAISHPEAGKRLDLSEDTNRHAGIQDASIFLYPSNGYGTQEEIRRYIELEKPDALFLITDPRYFVWLFQMEAEIRKQMPIIYLNIWDDYPAPMYNQAYYDSCDALLGISKQTVNINKLVLGEKLSANKVIEYVPHGLNANIFHPMDANNKDLERFRQALFGGKQIDFACLFNSRNIRRKQIPDLLLSWRIFLDKLSAEQRSKAALVLHTQPVDENGTDLPKIIDYYFEETDNIIFSDKKLSAQDMNLLYNSCDIGALLSSNEGWGLMLTECLLTGTPFIANVTGGMQDQMGFLDDNGEWFTPSAEVPSNHSGRYKQHGEWAFPVYPTSRSIQGSVPTPYIFDDRCDQVDVANRLMEAYLMSKEELKAKGLKGREWACSEEIGFTSVEMGKKAIYAMDKLFDTWMPQPSFEFINTNDYAKKVVPHAIVY